MRWNSLSIELLLVERAWESTTTVASFLWRIRRRPNACGFRSPSSRNALPKGRWSRSLTHHQIELPRSVLMCWALGGAGAATGNISRLTVNGGCGSPWSRMHCGESEKSTRQSSKSARENRCPKVPIEPECGSLSTPMADWLTGSGGRIGHSCRRHVWSLIR